HICVYTTAKRPAVRVLLKNRDEVILDETAQISPVEVYHKTVPAPDGEESDLRLEVSDGGKLLVSYQSAKPDIPKNAEPAQAAKDPDEIMNNEELLLTGLHIEQYRHATYLPDPYYLEGLKRDPGDARINNAYGCLLMRRGNYQEAEQYFRRALKRLTWKNPNPYNSEAYYNLGLDLLYQGREDEAYDSFFKATWTNEQQEMSFYYLAAICARKGEFEAALELVEKGLVKNAHNIKARGLKAVILRKLGKEDEALAWIRENLQVDPFDFLSAFEQYQITGNKEELIALDALMRGFHENYLMVARDYLEMGMYEEALFVLDSCPEDKPMLHYYAGYALSCQGCREESLAAYRKGEEASPLYCFPNKPEDIMVLEAAIASGIDASRAQYYLGCLFYDRLQFDRAIALWEASAVTNNTFPTVLRNLAIAYYNKRKDPQKARACMERAFELDRTDARIFLELDQLYKKLNLTVGQRLENYEKYAVGNGGSRSLVTLRDDLMIEYVTLLNSAGRYQECYETIMGHTFRPWEGAEGKVSAQYKVALVEMAKERIAAGQYKEAKELLEQSLIYPENLGEGRLEGTKDNNIWYLLGTVKESLGESDARDCFMRATQGTDEPAGMMYYYDQPADMILYKGLAYEKLGEHRAACACFNKLIDYGEKHIRDTVRIDYFAVSLPDFLIFEDDLTKRNTAHCYYLMGLGSLGLGDKEKAAGYLNEVKVRDQSHQNAILYSK
ncbi:MAG: tetratricopeptide repeat protein, partial [Lachnospiraceae bacterium]|nr:tetratricopeptide repeat protein [Lachnospiraceae bacterium]